MLNQNQRVSSSEYKTKNSFFFKLWDTNTLNQMWISTMKSHDKIIIFSTFENVLAQE